MSLLSVKYLYLINFFVSKSFYFFKIALFSSIKHVSERWSFYAAALPGKQGEVRPLRREITCRFVRITPADCGGGGDASSGDRIQLFFPQQKRQRKESGQIERDRSAGAGADGKGGHHAGNARCQGT